MLPGGVGADQRLSVTLLQLSAEHDRAANLRRGEAWLEQALRSGPGVQRPRLLMLPESGSTPERGAI
jgi:predicted amidohydrolase